MVSNKKVKIQKKENKMSSRVTKVKVSIISNPENKIIALSRIELNGDIVIDGVKVLSGKNGLFVGMPSRKAKDEKTWHEVVYGATKELKDDIKDSVLKEYHRENEGNATNGSESESESESEADDDAELPF